MQHFRNKRDPASLNKAEGENGLQEIPRSLMRMGASLSLNNLFKLKKVKKKECCNID